MRHLHSALLPSDGVGLAREEFIVTEYIRIHPMALVKFEKVKDPKIRKQIEELTAGYPDKSAVFRRQARHGRCDDCRRFLSTRCDFALQRFQDQ